MPDFSNLVDKHFKVANFPDQEGGKVTFTVSRVVPEEIGQSKELLPVVYFHEDPRGLVLSGAKYNTLAQSFGSRDTDLWIGKKVVVFIDWKVKFRGVAGGLKIEAAS